MTGTFSGRLHDCSSIEFELVDDFAPLPFEIGPLRLATFATACAFAMLVGGSMLMTGDPGRLNTVFGTNLATSAAGLSSPLWAIASLGHAHAILAYLTCLSACLFWRGRLTMILIVGIAICCGVLLGAAIGWSIGVTVEAFIASAVCLTPIAFLSGCIGHRSVQKGLLWVGVLIAAAISLARVAVGEVTPVDALTSYGFAASWAWMCANLNRFSQDCVRLAVTGS